MKKIVVHSLWLVLVLLAIAGCVKEDFDKVPPVYSNLDATTTIKEFRALYGSDATGLKQISKLYSQSFYNNLKDKGIDTSLLIKGVVVSSDSAGAFYKSVWIEDGTGGIEVLVEAKDMHSTYAFKPGWPVVLKLSDLYAMRSSSWYDVQIGVKAEEAGNLSLGRIDAEHVTKHIKLAGASLAENPLTVNRTEMKDDMVGRLIRIDGVEVVVADTSKPYADGTATTSRDMNDCDGNSIVLRTNGNAPFASRSLPNGNGSVIGVLTKYKTDVYQIVVRSEKDLMLVNDRCKKVVPQVNTTITTLRSMYKGGLYEVITSPVVIEATVVANDASGNLYKQIFLQDATGGMELKIDRKTLSVDYAIGQKVIVNCQGLFLSANGGVVQLGGTFVDDKGVTKFGGITAAIEAFKIHKVIGGSVVAPAVTTISAFSDANLMKLIQLDDVQFVDAELGQQYSPSNSTNRTLRDCGGAIVIVRTSSYANFAKTVLPDKKGTFVGILGKYNGTYQLILREAADANFTLTRCP